MSTDTPVPDDDRTHATDPAEGAEPSERGTAEREHATEPAEGEDPDA